MLTLHSLSNSQSIRILWLLEELGVEYQIEYYERDPRTKLAPADYKALHPIGTSPTITDGGQVLVESNAIMDYIMDAYGDRGLRPGPEAPERNRYLYWFHASQGSVMFSLTMRYVFNAMRTKVPFFLKPMIKVVVDKIDALFTEERLKALRDYMETQLSESTWLAGDKFTAADVAMGYCMETFEARGGLDNSYPNCQRFLQQMKARPAYQRALEKNGPFQALSGNEPG